MAKFIYIPAIEKNSWLHWSFRGSSSCIRDFRSSKTKEIRSYSTTEIAAYLCQPDSFEEPAPPVAYEHHLYWQDQIRVRNIESGFSSVQVKERLLIKFKKDLERCISSTPNGLSGVIEHWHRRLRCAQDKRRVFNHWDNDNAQSRISPRTGLGWTSHLLEHCRYNSKPSYIKIGKRPVCFAAMEISIGISSKRNPFFPNSVSSIRPDGLGIDKDGSLAIFEVKGPQDDLDPEKALLQGMLGAIAIHAKRDYIIELFKHEYGRRPFIRQARVPKTLRSISVYALVSSVNLSGQHGPTLTAEAREKLCMFADAAKMISRIGLVIVPRNPLEVITNDLDLNWLHDSTTKF